MEAACVHDLPQEMKDVYGNIYERYAGKIYKSKGQKCGNIAAFMREYKNNGLYVIYYGSLEQGTLETTAKNAVKNMGWKPEDWL